MAMKPRLMRRGAMWVCQSCNAGLCLQGAGVSPADAYRQWEITLADVRGGMWNGLSLGARSAPCKGGAARRRGVGIPG